jgi:hypothetical protein
LFCVHQIIERNIVESRIAALCALETEFSPICSQLLACHRNIIFRFSNTFNDEQPSNFSATFGPRKYFLWIINQSELNVETHLSHLCTEKRGLLRFREYRPFGPSIALTEDDFTDFDFLAFYAFKN